MRDLTAEAYQAVMRMQRRPLIDLYAFGFGYLKDAVENGTFTKEELKQIADGLNMGIRELTYA